MEAIAGNAVTLNGIDAATGTYLVPPMGTGQVARLAADRRPAPRELAELRARRHRDSQRFLGVREGIDPVDLSSAGWAVVFASDADQAVREALSPLLRRREEQAGGVHPHRYREFTGPDGLLPDDTKGRFLARHGIGPGPADPDRVPYYLLLVGSPDRIPFSVQHQLDVQYAVGRLDLPDIEGYARYADAVVAAETGTGRSGRRRGVLFAPRHDGDQATELSLEGLVRPLSDQLPADLSDRWVFDPVVGDAATVKVLRDVLSTAGVPDVLVTATHGLGFPASDPRQRAQQGALLCQDWIGPAEAGPVAREHYLAGEDVDPSWDLTGLVAFHLACFGAGTPATDGFAVVEAGPRILAPEAFVAALPQAMLTNPGGPALAVIGHVDRTWGYSFAWPGAGFQTEVVRSMLRRVCAGQPVGFAMEFLNQRYAELASEVAELVNAVEEGVRVDDEELAALWTASLDMRGYAVLGDPAVHIVPDVAAADVSGATPVAHPG